MENQHATRRTHPLVITASIAVILLCIAGIAALMGWIPKSGADSSAAPQSKSAAVEAKAPAARATAKKQAATARASRPLRVAPVARQPKPVCRNCGVIESIVAREKKGKASGLGAVSGGVLGGVVGHQLGGGRGRDVMTVLGAVGGAVAGQEIEKNLKKTRFYEITVRFDDGTTRVFSQSTQPTWRRGERVKFVNGALRAS